MLRLMNEIPNFFCKLIKNNMILSDLEIVSKSSVAWASMDNKM